MYQNFFVITLRAMSSIFVTAESVESFLMDLEYDGLYRAWPLLNTSLVTSKATFPLFIPTFSHFMIIEVCGVFYFILYKTSLIRMISSNIVLVATCQETGR